MSFDDYLAEVPPYGKRIDFSADFPGDQKDQIIAAMRAIYSGSNIAKTMIDDWLSPSLNPDDPYKYINIQFSPGKFKADIAIGGGPSGQLVLDLSFLNNFWFINDNGTAEKASLRMALAHELVHALKGLEDNWTDVDYKGATVIESNRIYEELGITKQNSYLGSDVEGVLVPGFAYTKGVLIDRSVVAGGNLIDWDSSAAGDSVDLLIGDGRDNVFHTGDGDDFLYGNGGSDILRGGAGNDKLYGGDDVDILIGGADDDTLESGKENDILMGGTGWDRYVYKSGDGFDVIEDEREGDEQRGAIQFNDTILSGGSRPEGQTTYRWEGQNGEVYTADGDPDEGEVNLTISGADGAVSVLKFKNGDLGITLKDDDEEKRGKPGTGLPGGHPGSLPQVPWPVIRDPLVLDLDGDGVETTRLVQQWVAFDHQGDGMRERSAWVGADDGLLVLDRDGNSTIDSGKELFGTDTVLRSGLRAKSGLQALAEWDSNQDGKIDSQDAIYAELQVWQDLNQDGVSQTGELKRLDEQGIASIKVALTSGHAANATWMRRAAA